MYMYVVVARGCMSQPREVRIKKIWKLKSWQTDLLLLAGFTLLRRVYYVCICTQPHCRTDTR